MYVKATGQITDIWKSKHDGWCLRTKINDGLYITYIRLKKPQKSIGAKIRKGTEI